MEPRYSSCSYTEGLNLIHTNGEMMNSGPYRARRKGCKNDYSLEIQYDYQSN